ncbi:MAG TPA: isochorismatase family protein [Actinomycetota bacterium]|nr:isochorismatase family protein [Actinomycetota bacterium]
MSAASAAPSYDAEAALLVVDVQNDFAAPWGSLYVDGGEEVVPVINREIARALEAGATVLYTQDWHPASTPHFEKDGGIWPVHCVAETEGAALHPELRVAGDVVRKGTGGEDGYSGFTVRDPRTGEETPTRLADLLREHGIRRLVVAGIATDYCVKETVLDAARLGFDVSVLGEGIRAVNREPGDADRAVAHMRAAGATVVGSGR